MAKRWVIKLGSGLLTRQDGKVDRVQIGRIADQVAGLMRKGIEVVIVSSGAVAAGMTAMNLEKRPKDARELQACATVGQPELMSVYGRHFARHGRGRQQRQRQAGVPTQRQWARACAPTPLALVVA